MNFYFGQTDKHQDNLTTWTTYTSIDINILTGSHVNEVKQLFKYFVGIIRCLLFYLRAECIHIL